MYVLGVRVGILCDHKTRYFSLEQFGRCGIDTYVEILGLHRSDGTADILAAHGAVADHYHFVERLVVLLQQDIATAFDVGWFVAEIRDDNGAALGSL